MLVTLGQTALPALQNTCKKDREKNASTIKLHSRKKQQLPVEVRGRHFSCIEMTSSEETNKKN